MKLDNKELLWMKFILEKHEWKLDCTSQTLVLWGVCRGHLTTTWTHHVLGDYYNKNLMFNLYFYISINMAILQGRTLACMTFYNMAGTTMGSGSLSLLWGYVQVPSAVNGRVAMNFEKQVKAMWKLEQHNFVVMSWLWTSEGRIQIIFPQVK